MRTLWTALIVTAILALGLTFWSACGKKDLDPEVEEAVNGALDEAGNSFLVSGGSISLSGTINPNVANPDIKQLSLNGTVGKEASQSTGGSDESNTGEPSADITEAEKKSAELIVSGLSRAWFGSGGGIELAGAITPSPVSADQKRISLNGTIGSSGNATPDSGNTGGDTSQEELEKITDLIVSGLGSRLWFGAGGEIKIEGSIKESPTTENQHRISLNGTIENSSGDNATPESNTGTGMPGGDPETIADLVVQGLGSRLWFGGGGISLSGTIKPDPADSTRQIVTINGAMSGSNPSNTDPDIEKICGLVVQKLGEASRNTGGKMSLSGSIAPDPADNSIQKVTLNGTLEMFPEKPENE